MGNGGSAGALTRQRIAGLAGAVLCAALLAVPGMANADQCRPDLALLTMPDGKQAQFRIEIADDEAERAQGLMNRERMAHSAGMLFVYPTERPVAFWMRDTLIPLDMLFIDGAGRVVSIHDKAQPLDETPIPSGGPVQFVLEINGGLAHAIGIVPGAVLSHPAIAPAQALRPCD